MGTTASTVRMLVAGAAKGKPVNITDILKTDIADIQRRLDAHDAAHAAQQEVNVAALDTIEIQSNNIQQLIDLVASEQNRGFRGWLRRAIKKYVTTIKTK